MKSSSKKKHVSFVLSEEVSKNRQAQTVASFLLIVVLALQVYTLYETIDLFKTSLF